MARTRGKKQQHKKPTRLFRHLAAGAAAVVLAFGIGATVYARAYQGKILPGVSVGEVRLGGMTLAAGRQRLAAAVAAYEPRAVTITIGSGTLTPHLKHLGMAFDIEATLKRAYAVGRPSLWSSFFALPVLAHSDLEPVSLLMDEATLRAYGNDIETRFSTAPIEPMVRTVNGSVVVLPGRPGQSVTFPSLREPQVIERISRLQTVTLEAKTTAVPPRHSAADVEQARAELESLSKQSIVLTYGARRYPIATTQLAEWLEVDPNVPAASDGSIVSINPRRSEEFFAAIADDVFQAPKRVKAYASREHGEYAYKNAEGRGLDRATTMRNILAALRASAATAEAVTSASEPLLEFHPAVAPKPTGKVISVDLTNQTAFAHEDGELLFWTHASTGKGGYKTPTGEWKVYGKTARQVMDGPGYYLPNVKWVLPYNGDYTLHGTYWHTNFGVPMSHGCTNLSENDAKWFYDWAEVGTPVVVYES